ncbi:MAG: hypothetical protein ACREA0_00685 [bacterium]
MDFEIVSEIERVEVIARGRAVRQRTRLVQQFGGRGWRKMKGEASVVRGSQEPRPAELHWYEAHGVGRHEFKIKRYLSG